MEFAADVVAIAVEAVVAGADMIKDEEVDTITSMVHIGIAEGLHR